MDFGRMLQKPDKRFSPAAFWFWYGTLEPDKLRQQLDMMAQQHVWNAFMHSRAYLETEYLGDAWWNAVSAVIDEAKKLGFNAWMYDEYAWPSGTAGSTFPDDPHQKPSPILANEKFHARFLYPVCAGESPAAGDALLRSFDTDSGRLDFYIGSQPHCVDYMNGEAIAQFMELTHERYKARYSGEFGGTVPGIFFDEIYMSGKLPWTPGFENEFAAVKGYDILEKLPQLVEGDDDAARNVREDYFDVVAGLYEKAFFKRIGDWCAANDLMLTGHTEEFVGMHPFRQGDYFKTMRNLQIPGADCHSYRYSYPRKIALSEPKYSVSVARLYNKPQSMSESMGGAGWACTLQEYKRGINAMTAAGISMHVLHGFSYETRTQGEQGDWPASFFFQNPYWSMFKNFADYVSRVCSINEAGEAAVNVGLYYPIRDMKRGTINGRLDEKAMQIARSFDRSLNVLMNNQIDADFVDADSILNAEYSDGIMHAGKEKFSIIVVHENCELEPEVSRKLENVVVVRYSDCDMLPELIAKHMEQPVAVIEGDKRELFVNRRIIDGRDVYFIANCTPEARHAKIRIKGSGIPVRYDIETCRKSHIDCAISGDTCEFSYEFGSDEAFYVAFEQQDAAACRPAGEQYILPDAWQFIQENENGWLEVPFATVEGRKTMICDTYTGRGNVGRFVTDWRGKWITRRFSWGDNSDKCDLYFRREFDMAAAPQSAKLCICAVGGYELRINGNVAVTGNGWRSPDIADVSGWLRSGKNLLEIHVHNDTPLYGNNNLWKETIDPDELISLLMQLEISADGQNTIIVSDSSFIVSDEYNDRYASAKTVNPEKASSFGKGAKPGEWVYAWERGNASMQPWGAIPLFGKPITYPREVVYSVELPENCTKAVLPDITGEYTCRLNGQHIAPDAITSGGVLEIILNAQNADDGLNGNVKAAVAPIAVQAGDWRTHGMNDYSGACTYSAEFDFDMQQGHRYVLKASGIKWYASVTVNGIDCGNIVWQPYELDITGALHDGHNSLCITVANTAANARRHMLCDAGQAIGWNRYWNEDNMDRDAQNYESGLTGNVCIEGYVEERS